MNSSAQHTSDEYVLQLLREDSPRGLSVLYDRYGAVVYGVLLKACEMDVVADKLFEKTWIQAGRDCAFYSPGHGSMLSWLLGIARQQVAAYNKGTIRAQTDLENFAGMIKKGGHPSAPDACSKLLEMIYYKGYTASHIAHVSGLDEKLIIQNIRKALKNVSGTSEY